MAICKHCVHCVVCKEIESLPQRKDFVWYRAESGCPHFKNKTDFVEVKHGEWVEKDITYNDEIVDIAECSICGSGTPIEFLPPYCCNCGAKMDLKGGVQNDRT